MIAEACSGLSNDEVEKLRELCRNLCAEQDPEKWGELVEKLRQVIPKYLATRRPN